ncbi:hypothetical protein [Prevotellamassilia timonensis]|uniref:hypothetical protein n=1 Tax=Prevotellamassilia timonensis TaxID=1852370 RepID=UPI003A8EC1D5
MKLTNHLSRVLAATLFGLGCHTAALHAQNIMLHLDAPQGTDAQTLAADIGTLKITFSNSNDFFDTSLYAANTLDLGSNYYYDRNSSKDKYHKYYSRELTLNADDGNGNAWWGNTNKIEFKFDNLRRYAGVRVGDPIYYRIYSPHFSRIITGQIDPTDADEVTLHHTELVQARRVTFMPPVDRDGNAVPAILAPDLRIGTCNGFRGYNPNMQDLTEPFARYAYKGDTLRYLVVPNSSELALHADSIVVADTTTCVTTDYRKAVECRFYITDSQGQLCPVTNGQLASVYYKPQPGAKGKGNYHGYGCYNLGGIFLNTLTAPDGTHAAYALPGRQTFQLRMPTVQTTDPDFLMPYNADLGYILGEVTIPASTEPVSLSIAQSNPLRVTTTLADAVPYADHLQFSAYTYVNPPYSWQENKQMSVACKEVSRQVKGNDLVVTTLVEGSTYPYLALNAQYGAQSDTIASVLSKQCCLYSYPGDPRTEFSLTYKNFYDGNFNTLPAFSQLHPVKFVVPCHQFQTGRMLNLFGKYGQADRVAELAEHHDGCAKQLHYASADPIPYDTITIMLPEGKYDWVMQKDADEANDAPHHSFTLGATDTLVQRLQPTDFALLRVNCLGVDSIYVYNKVPEYQWYSLSKLTKGCMYYVREAIPLSPGYNERTITWREAKLQKDTLYSLSYWLEDPVIWLDEDFSFYTSYTIFSRPNNYLRLEKLETATPDSAICISTGSKANLAVWSGGTFAPARFFTISPSEADTTVTVYTQKTVRVNFSYKGGRVPGFERLNMCYGNEQTHIVPNSNFYRRSRMDLEPGHYTMSGVVSYEADATGEYVTTPFSIAFDIEANTPTTIELCPDPTAIAAAPADSAPAKAAACYAPDGRRISTSQPGLNIIKMTDGSVRKVIVK